MHQQSSQCVSKVICNIGEKILNNQIILYEQHLATAGRKNSLLTRRDLCHNQAQGGTAICWDCLGVESKAKGNLYFSIKKKKKQQLSFVNQPCFSHWGNVHNLCEQQWKVFLWNFCHFIWTSPFKATISQLKLDWAVVAAGLSVEMEPHSEPIKETVTCFHKAARPAGHMGCRWSRSSTWWGRTQAWPGNLHSLWKQEPMECFVFQPRSVFF